MAKKDSKFQVKFMSFAFRGKEIFKPLNTGFIDKRVSCIREYVANIYFYTKDGHTIMIDAGYNYDRLAEKMQWLYIDPKDIKEILITHQDTDHVGAIEKDSDGIFSESTVYIGEIENEYLEGRKRRKVFWGLYKLPQVYIDNRKVLIDDGQVFYIGNIKIEAFLVPGHTGWTDDIDFAFAHVDEICNSLRRKPKVHDPKAPYDGFDERDDTEANARNVFLDKC